MARPSPSLRFTLDDPTTPHFGPRLGTLVLSRPSEHTITLPTPTLLTPTSRGVVPHLTRTHVRTSPGIGLVHVPFETFLEQIPPVPTLQPGPNALHRFLGFDIDKHIVVMSVRDPADTREMPPNGNGHLNAYTLRGVRKITPGEWTSHTNACTPDIVVSLSDTPYTAPPFSYKRLTKSIDRSIAWLASLLSSSLAPSILLHLSGSASHPARAAFSASLTAPLNDLDSALIGGLQTYDAGVAGYTIDLVHLRSSSPTPTNEEAMEDPVPALLHTSLSTLPHTKPRFATGLTGPHDILRLVRDVGIDVLDARWAVDAASVGVALDFVFPVPRSVGEEKKEIGHNLYGTRYRLDFSPLSSTLSCTCIACSPREPTHIISHDTLPTPKPTPTHTPPLTCAYIHHLLTTHEMSAHTLLCAHNIAVVSSFLAGVRSSSSSSSAFADEVSRFSATYFEEGHGGTLLRDARAMWGDVERARGKGRLRREKEKEGGVEGVKGEDGEGKE